MSFEKIKKKYCLNFQESHISLENSSIFSSLSSDYSFRSLA